MTIAHVVTGGFGNGTFAGQIRQIVVGGFFDSAVTPIQVTQFVNLAVPLNSGSHAYGFATYFTGETSYSISPAIETGWSFDTNTGILTVDTDDDGLFGPYTVRATNTAGNTDGEAFYVNVSTSSGIRSRGLNLHLGIGL